MYRKKSSGSGSGRNHHWFRPEHNSLKNSIVSKLFHKLIQLTKTISDYGEEIKVFRQFLEEVCFFFISEKLTLKVSMQVLQVYDF